MVNFIEFPIFDGVSGDLRAWISWLEDFFVRERFTEDEKMNLAQSLLEGEANAWFYSSRKRFAFQSWEHLVVELLIWRFGDFGDGGVFSDLELFLLWNKYDRILRKRRKRMTTTSIPEKNLNLTASRETTDSTLATKSIQEAISDSVLDGDASIEKDESYEATMVKVEDDTTMFQVSDSLEEESIHQNQVPVASVEPSLSFSCESLVVSDARQSEIVSNNWVHSQSVLECVKNKATAYQVFDKTSLHKERLKPRNKRKLSSLSLKTWKFKFKNKNLQHNWSQMDLHQVIDRSKVNHLLCFSANFGLVRNRRTFQCLRLKKQAHKSKVLYQLRWLHDPGGKKDEHFDEIFETGVDIGKVQRTQMDIVAESVITAPDNVAPSTDVIPNRQNWNAACDVAIDALDGTATWIVVSLPATNIEEAVEIAQVTLLLQLILDDLKSHMRHKWKSKHLRAVFDLQSNLSSALVVINKPVTECQNTDAIFQLVLERTVSHEWHRWKHKTAYLQGLLELYGLARMINWSQVRTAYSLMQGQLWEKVHMVSCLSLGAQLHSLEVVMVVLKIHHSLRNTRFKSREMQQFVGFMKFQLKHKWRSKHFHTISALEFYLSSVFPIVTSAYSCSGCKRMNERLQVHTILIVFAVKSQVKNKWRLVQRIWRLHNQWLILLPQESKIHKVFHVSQLKAVLGDHQQVHSSVPSELLAEDNWIPEAVLDVRFDEVGRREFLIPWQNQDSSANSGLLFTEFVRLFPSFKLEDKLGLQGVSIDTIQCLIVGIDDVARVKRQTEDSD